MQSVLGENAQNRKLMIRSVMLPCTWEHRKFSSRVIKVVLRLRVSRVGCFTFDYSGFPRTFKYDASALSLKSQWRIPVMWNLVLPRLPIRSLISFLYTSSIFIICKNTKNQLPLRRKFSTFRHRRTNFFLQTKILRLLKTFSGDIIYMFRVGANNFFCWMEISTYFCSVVSPSWVGRQDI